MLKKLFAILLVLPLLFSSAFADGNDSQIEGESNYQEIRLMDTGDNVLVLKKYLVAIGALDEAAINSSVYDVVTMNAVKAIQEGFGLPITGIATPEMQVICQLMANYSGSTSNVASPTVTASPTSTPAPTATPVPKVPNLCGLTADEASNVVRQYGFIPELTYEYNDEYDEGDVCAYKQNNSTQRVVMTISQGPYFVSAKNSTAYWFYVTGSDNDHYEFINPYLLGDTMYIEMDVTLDSDYYFYFRGYGTACINDTFDKVVPIEVEYEREEMKAGGDTQHIILKIPVSDLGVKKPTTLSVKIETYRSKKKNHEEAIRLDFTATW